MTGPRLILHVGHPKTGSSALQCAFARSIPALADHGIHYPPPPDAEAVRAGRINSGNVHAPRIAERYRAERRRARSDDAILFSTEAGFRVLPDDPAPLIELLEGGVALEVVLFLRNPVGLARSIYAQMVQRHGLATDFDTFLVQFSFLDRVERFLDLATRLHLPLWVWNYADAPAQVLGVMEGILSLPDDTLDMPPVARVNRSLTRTEMRAIQGLADRHGAGAARAAGDALCDRLPNIPPDPPTASAAAYSAMSRRLAPQIDRLNARLDPSVQYRIEGYEEAFGTTISPLPGPLSDAQRTVIDEALATWQARPAPSLKTHLVRTLNQNTPGLARALRQLRDRLPR